MSLTSISPLPKWLEERLNQEFKEWVEVNMDKEYKKIGKEAGKLKSDTKKVLAKDKDRDSDVKAGKKAKMMEKKGKC